MTRFLSALLLVLPMFVSGQIEKYIKVRVFTESSEEFEKIVSAGLPADHIVYRPGAFAELEILESELQILNDANLEYHVLIDDLSKFYVERNQLDQAESSRNSNCDPAPAIITPSNFQTGSMGGFFTYQEMLDNLDSMAAKYPNLISAKQPVGSFLTHEGRPLYWLKISDNPGIDENEPEILYTALHHAREPASMSQLIFYMWYLLENYSTDPDIKVLVDNLEMYFMPCLNPDGYIYNQTTNPSGGGMWRKNMRNNGDGTFGVDLNRNYAYAWGYDNTGSSPQTNSFTYRGPAPFSEPELQAVKFFCENHDFKLALNYHTYGDLLIYPWGYEESIYTPDSAIFVEHAKLLTEHNHYHYGTGDQTVGYVTNGDSDDWMYGEQSTKNKIFAMTPEAGLASDGFWPVQSRIIPICKVNIGQNLNLARLALKHGKVTDRSPGIFDQTSVYIPFDIQRLGLDSPATFTVSLIPVANVLSAGTPKVLSGMQLLEARTDSIQITLPPGITRGSVIQFVLSVDNGMYTVNDTLTKYFGPDTLIASHNGNSLSGWTTTAWGLSTSQFVSAPSSITDSPNGNYPNNTTRIISLDDAIDLTGMQKADLRFMARWEIEPGYDYARVLASTDGSVWTPLCGKYTKPGTSNQTNGTPVFDGFQYTWVEEIMNLDDYTGNLVYIRFHLRSDAFVTEDGFYFDDLEVRGVPDPNPSVKEIRENTLELFPNPASDLINVKITSGDNQPVQARVYDITGKEAGLYILKPGLNQINTKSLPVGIYFLSTGNSTARFAVIR